MMSELLPEYVDAVLEENEDLLGPLIAGHATLEEVLQVCRNYRVAAIGSLLVTGLSREFRRRLHQSGTAFAYFLERTSDGDKSTGKSAPFLDAIAAGDLQTAEKIAQASRHTWLQGEEYEEDFLLFEFLMRHFFLGAGAAECEALLVRYEQSLVGTEDVRLDVCRALFAAQAEEFSEALDRFLEHRQTRLDALAARESILDEELATVWHLSVEGVAFTRLATSKNMAVRAAYLHVPSVALEDAVEAWPLDDWRVPDPSLD